MSPVLWIAVLGAVFVACRWSGYLLGHHYADRAELGAVALVGVCVVGPLALGASAATVWGAPVRLLLALAVVGGLLVAGSGRPISRAV